MSRKDLVESYVDLLQIKNCTEGETTTMPKQTQLFLIYFCHWQRFKET